MKNRDRSALVIVSIIAIVAIAALVFSVSKNVNQNAIDSSPGLVSAPTKEQIKEIEQWYSNLPQEEKDRLNEKHELSDYSVSEGRYWWPWWIRPELKTVYCLSRDQWCWSAHCDPDGPGHWECYRDCMCGSTCFEVFEQLNNVVCPATQ